MYATSGNKGNKDDDADTEIETDFNADATDSHFTGMVDYMTNNDLVSGVDGDQTLKSWYIQMGTAATSVDEWAEAAGTLDQLMVVSHRESSLVDVQATLEAAFIEALSLSSTFVAASVPVNVFNRIQTLDNFYIALFEAQTTERWSGNIKKLKSNIKKFEVELKTLRARAKVSSATKKINQQMAGVDSSSTVAMLERMKEKVDQDL